MTVGGETTYTTPIVRSMAGVASMALGDPDAVHTSLLTTIVDSVAEGFSFTETSMTLDLGEMETLTLTGTNGLTPTYTVSDDTTVWVSESGEIQGLKNGTATVTATIGSYTDTIAVTVESAGSGNGVVINKDGTVKFPLKGTTELPYIGIANCGVGTTIEVEYTGKNTPGIRFMGETLNGNITTGVGYVLHNDAQSGLRISDTKRAASTATVVDAGHNMQAGSGNYSTVIDDNTTYVIRASIGQDNASPALYKLYVTLYIKAEDGTLTKKASANRAVSTANITAANEHYLILLGNAKGAVTFKYKVTQENVATQYVNNTARVAQYSAVDGYTQVYNSSSSTPRVDQCYVGFDYQIGTYAEVKWTGVAMPTVRIGTTALTNNMQTNNYGGYIIHNSIGETGADGVRTAKIRVSIGTDVGTACKASANFLTAGVQYVLRTAIEEKNGVKYLYVKIYENASGVLTEKLSLVDYEAKNILAAEKYYVSICGNAEKGTTTSYFNILDEKSEVENLQINKTNGVVSWAKATIDTADEISVNGGEWIDVTSTGYTANYTIENFDLGTYKVSIRAKDANGMYTILTTKTFTVATETPAPVAS